MKSRWIVCTLLALATSYPFSASAGNPTTPLDEIEIEIAWEDKEGTRFSERFELPADCEKLNEYAEQYSTANNVNLGRRVGGSAYCERVVFLRRGAKSSTHDYVSHEDFTDLPLSLVPFQLHCVGMHHPDWLRFCTRVEQGDATVCLSDHSPPELSYATFDAVWVDAEDDWRLLCEPPPAVGKNCRLREGTFRGTVSRGSTGIQCARVDEGEGMKLYDVRFRDMNRDGFMDVVLSFVEVRMGSAPPGRVRAVVTRRSQEGSLEMLRLD